MLASELQANATLLTNSQIQEYENVEKKYICITRVQDYHLVLYSVTFNDNVDIVMYRCAVFYHMKYLRNDTVTILTLSLQNRAAGQWRIVIAINVLVQYRFYAI